MAFFCTVTKQAGLAFGLLAALSAPTRAEPAVSEETITYEISGSTTAELADQMAALGPEGGWAYTKWYVSWTGDCNVSVEITYTYPEWTDRDEADESVVDAWDAMMEALETHEAGHAENGMNAAREVEDAGCPADSEQMVARWAEEDITYDAQTNHGYTQGAHF